LNNAADTNLNRFLTVWEGDVTDPPQQFRVRGRVYEVTDLVPPPPVQSFSAQPHSRALLLTWTNPNSADFTGTMIRTKLGSPPSSPTDGSLLIDQPGTAGSTGSYLQRNLSSGTTYYYAAFAHDTHPNYAAGVTVTGIPATLGDFDADGDVDQSDFAFLQTCYSGDAVAFTTACIDADVDVDGDVDGIDFGSFVTCLAGADQVPGC
jgi:hypothetical protein